MTLNEDEGKVNFMAMSPAKGQAMRLLFASQPRRSFLLDFHLWLAGMC